jgi:hypothetical protein
LERGGVAELEACRKEVRRLGEAVRRGEEEAAAREG